MRGSRVSLTDLVRHFLDGTTAEEIPDVLPTISLEVARQVFAFYARNTAEVDAILATEDAAIAKARAEAPPGPSLSALRKRYAELKAAARR